MILIAKIAGSFSDGVDHMETNLYIVYTYALQLLASSEGHLKKSLFFPYVPYYEICEKPIE